MRIKMITLFMISVFAVAAQPQENLKIGDVKNGKLVIVNPDILRAFFVNYLGKSGILGKDFRINYSPDKTRILVHCPVSSNKDKISCAGVMLVNIDNEAFIVANPPANSPGGPGGGGSVTYSCIGNPCEDCEINITWLAGSWLPDVSCGCADPEGHCNMSVSYTINVNIGLY